MASLKSHWLGPLRRPALITLNWAERRVLVVVRRHPLWSATITAVAFGAAVGGNQSIREGYLAPAALLTVILLSCGMFAFLIAAGSYLGLVRSTTALAGVSRRALDATVLTCVGMLVALAFRDSLWWLVGSNPAAARLPQLYALLALTAATVFAVVFAIESLRRFHAKPPGSPITPGG